MLAVVSSPATVIVTKFLGSAIDYYCNADEIGVRDGCEEGRRLRVQGTVAAESVETDGGITTFTIVFGDAAIPVRYEGEPGGIFAECEPVVVHGRLVDGVFQGDQIEVKHSNEYDGREPRSRRCRPLRLPRRRGVIVSFIAISANAAFGKAGIVLALAAAAGGAIVTVVGLRAGDRRLLRQGPIYAGLCLAGAAIAALMMQRALITRDFSLAYIQQVGSATTPRLYNVAAMWSALEGSILLWLLILGGFTAAVGWKFRRRTADPLVAWALVVMFVVMAFFALVSFGPADPFGAGVSGPRTSDPGPNPLLQNHVLVLFHPPILYLGYVGMTVPFAFAIAALITGRVGEGWLLETRRWALFAWAFLTIGILLGGWWSYAVLGWSGVWAWDPVENASLLPWLTATAYIHSVLVQERRGMLRVWNLSLLVATFALTILGTFLTRSGVLSSVHAFGDGPVGAYLLGFFGVVVVASLALIGWRGDRLRSPGTIDSPLSRGGRVPGQQRAVRRVRLRRPPRNAVPAARRGAPGPPDQRRRAVLRSADDAARAGPAVPDGRRPGAAVAQGERRAARRAAVLAGGVRRRRPRRRRRRRGDRLGAAASRSASVGGRPARRCARSSWRPAARVGEGSSGGPTAG